VSVSGNPVQEPGLFRKSGLIATLSMLERAALIGGALFSMAILYAALGDFMLMLGMGLGVVLLGVVIITLRSSVKTDAGAAQDMGQDWTLMRDIADQDGAALAVTDRAGRMVCANSLYSSWFPNSAVPPGLALDGQGKDRLTTAGRAAWRDGRGKIDALTYQGLQLSAEIIRSGRQDDYLVWRFRPVANVDRAQQAAELLVSQEGRSLGQAGVMAVLVTADGRIQAANSAFHARAGGNAQSSLVGRDIASLIRADDRGMLFFVVEGDKATPVRLFQMPLQVAVTPGDPQQGGSQQDASAQSAPPLLLAMVDEDGGPVERGIALSYIESLLSLLPFGLAMVDRDGRFLFVNAAFRQSVGLNDGRLPLYPGDLVLAEDKTAIADAVRRYATGQQLAGDITVRLKHQPEDAVPIGLAGVRGMGQAAVLLSLKDTGEETALKRQVAQATKMQAVGQLAGGVAHDFNNILTAIIGHVDLMLMRQTPGDSDYDDLQQVRGNAMRAASLTRQLLAFSRQQTLRPQILQLADVISEVSALLTRLIGEKIRLVVSHGRGVGAVRADPTQLEQVIVNLAVNARDAMLSDGAKSGTLLIETFAMSAAQIRKLGIVILPNADFSVLRISDTGTGIASDILPKIFEPFFTTKDVGKGTGLGLSTVYGIVKQSGGYIFADSPAPAAARQKLGSGSADRLGSSFTIYLPLHAKVSDGEVIAAAPQKPAKEKSEWGSGTILLVEDEDMVRAVAERALVRAGYTVITADNGEDALEKLASIQDLDLLLTDVVMPLMDGPALVEAVRKTRPDLPVLFMSGYAEEQLRQSITIDRVQFLPKPFSVTQISAAVQGALNTQLPQKA
jgi:two-component system, cell cycle sensor histidine kinase and response regulator CckA